MNELKKRQFLFDIHLSTLIFFTLACVAFVYANLKRNSSDHMTYWASRGWPLHYWQMMDFSFDTPDGYGHYGPIDTTARWDFRSLIFDGFIAVVFSFALAHFNELRLRRARPIIPRFTLRTALIVLLTVPNIIVAVVTGWPLSDRQRWDYIAVNVALGIVEVLYVLILCTWLSRREQSRTQ